jgi:DNA modification methylase
VWRFNIDAGSLHPAPFPVRLPAKAIETVAPHTVLDPFAGSGTTLVAAKQAGVMAIGIEKSEQYCEIAARRLAQGSLFEVANV